MSEEREELVREYESIIEELEQEIYALRGKVPVFFKQ